MMLAIFVWEHQDDWDDILPPVMMAYCSSVHESTGFSPFWLMFGEECTLPMDVGHPRLNQDSPDPIQNMYAMWVRDASDQVRCHTGQALRRQKRLYDKRAVKHVFAVGDWTLKYYPPAKKFSISPWLGPYLVVSLIGWQLVFNCTWIRRSFWYIVKIWRKFLARGVLYPGSSQDKPDSLSTHPFLGH